MKKQPGREISNGEGAALYIINDLGSIPCGQAEPGCECVMIYREGQQHVS